MYKEVKILKNKKETLHTKVYERLKDQILNFPEGAKLPSESELCESFSVSRTVLREAMVLLEKEGFVVRRQGLGTFVVKDSKLVHMGVEYLRGIFRIISSSGRRPSFLLNEYEGVKAEKEVAKRLQIDKGERIVKAKHLYAADDIPVIYSETYLATNRIQEVDKFIKIAKQNKTKVLFELLEEDFQKPVKYAITEIVATISDQTISGLLKVDSGKPVLLLLEVHYGLDDLPLLYSKDYVNTDVFTIQVVREKI
jgi:GntR family transcriptional regulator